MKEEEKKSSKNIILFTGIIIVIICIVLGIFILNHKQEMSLNHKQDIYKFDFYDGSIPGETFNGEINLTNGKVNFKIMHGCSLLNPDECPDDTIVKGTLKKAQLKLVKNALEKNNREDNPSLIIGISYLIKGDKICDKKTNETCNEIGRELVELSN